MSAKFKEVLRELSDKITEVYDLGLAEEMTDIYIDLVTRADEASRKYWELVRTLAAVEKERDELRNKLNEEHRLRLDAEYDKEYYAMQLMEHMD